MATKLFTIEVLYKQSGGVHVERLRNITGPKLKEFRETFFTVGFAVVDKDDARHWVIISPFNIVSIDVWLQDKFFRE